MRESDWAAWAQMRDSTAALQSPYFHPEYTQLLAELRPDVRVVCQNDKDGTAIAFLPVQGGRFTRPVGAPMSDYHAIITNRDDITYDSLLGETGIGAYHYSCAADPQRLRMPQILAESETAAIDIETTAEAWRADRDGSYRRHLKSNRRRTRKAEDAFGAKRIELFSRDIDVFTSLLKWKREKFALTGKYDVLSAEWTQGLIRTLWERGQKADLRCDMHAVAYDDELAEFGPGIQLLEALIDATPETGYKRIDMGEGLDGYKRHYASASQRVVSGLVPLSGAAGRLSRIYAAAERWGVGPLKDAPGKLRRRYTQIAACEDGAAGRIRHMLAAVAGSRRG